MNSNPNRQARLLSAIIYLFQLVCIASIGMFFAVWFLKNSYGIEKFFVWGGMVCYTTFTSTYVELPIALLCWLISRHAVPFVRQNCRKLVNFQLSSMLYSTFVISVAYYFGRILSRGDYLGPWMLFALLIFIAPFILIFKISTLMRGAIFAWRGGVVTHCFSIPFLR